MLVNISSEYPDMDSAESAIRQIRQRAGNEITDIRVNQNKNSLNSENDFLMITTGITTYNYFTNVVNAEEKSRQKAEPYQNSTVRINVQCKCTALDKVRQSIVSSGGMNIIANS